MERLKVTDDGRALETVSGAPFFWMGDTAWELFHRLTMAETTEYLSRRSAQGFNVIEAAVLAECDGLRTPNTNGDVPLIDNDPTRLNEAYFAHVDAVIDLAAAYHLYMGILPTWGDKVVTKWGVGPVVFNAENACIYGELLGTRWRDRPTIVWVLGGDRNPVYDEEGDFIAIWRAMAAGIRAGYGDDALITYHPQGGSGSSTWLHDEDWLDFHQWQSGHVRHDMPIWDWISGDLARTPLKPSMDGEPCYEDHPVDAFTRTWKPEYGRFRDHDVRKQMYRAILAGACGHTYGHHSVWQFYDARYQPINFPEPAWQEAVERPAANQIIYLRRLLDSLPSARLMPDQSLLLDAPGEGGQHIRAARAADGAYALIYFPEPGQSMRVDTNALGTRVNVRWYNPQSGEMRFEGTVEGSLNAVSPPDWVDSVLILDQS